MKRASSVFGESDRAAIARAVGEVERATSGEIVPVVATVSGRYDRAEDLFGLAVALAVLCGAWVLFQGTTEAPWIAGAVPRMGLGWVVLTVAIGFVAGAALASRFPILRHPFIPHREMREEVERGAREAFSRSRVGRTADATGVLIYVSLYERMVRVLADDAVAAHVSDAQWQAVCDQVTAGMKAGNPAEGLAQAIRTSASLLAAQLPARPGDRNELPDALVILD